MLYKANQTARSFRKNNSGLTLLELIAGISVLVAMAGMSLEFLDRFHQESAYRVTLERLEIIKNAMHEYSADTVVNRMGNTVMTPSNPPPVINPPSPPFPAQSVEDFGIIHNDAPDAGPSTVNLHSITVPSSVADLSRYLPGWGSFASEPSSSVPNFEVYQDGWGNFFQYRNAVRVNFPSTSMIQTHNQCKAYLWSFGADGVSDCQFDANGDLVANSQDDDILYTLDFTEEFDAEAQRRVDEINAALKRYLALNGALLPEQTGTARSFRRAIFEPLVLAGVLPADNRYLFNPWRIRVHGADVGAFYGGNASGSECSGDTGGAHGNVVAQTFSPAGVWPHGTPTSQTWPVGEVSFLKSR